MSNVHDVIDEDEGVTIDVSVVVAVVVVVVELAVVVVELVVVAIESDLT